MKLKIKDLTQKGKVMLTGAVTTGMVVGSNVLAYAEGTGLDADVKTAIQGGFTTNAGMIKDVIIIGVPATIGIIALSQGAKYGIRWVRSMVSKA